MAQGYYTLEEAAKYLGISTDDLKQRARTKNLRSFQDRGTLHFRAQDIEELGRERSANSDPELPLGEASLPPKSSGTPEVFDFAFDAAPDLGSGLMLGETASSAARKSPKRPPSKEGSDSDVRLVADGGDLDVQAGSKPSGLKSPSDAGRRSKLGGPPSGGSRPSKLGGPPASGGPRQSKLGGPAPGGSRPSKLGGPPASGGPARTSKLGPISGGATRPSKLGGPGSSKVVPGASGVSRPSKLGGPPSPATPGRSPRPGSGPQPIDSGVRLVPMDSDSELRIMGGHTDEIDLGASPPVSLVDSSVRLEGIGPPAGGSQNLLQTEEINLDEELRKQDETRPAHPPSRVKAKSELRFPTSSPFELSEMDADMPSELKPSPTGLTESSDFDLVPAADGSTGAATQDDSDDFSLELGDDNQVLNYDRTGSDELSGPTSGLSLDNPADAGISLEEAPANDESLDFDLSLEVEGTPRPTMAEEDGSSHFELTESSAELPAHTAAESSEFELSLDLGDEGVATAGDSEFDLSLDVGDAGSEGEGSSEFELTLDDSGGLSPLESDAPQVKASTEDEENVFESDFEVPDLDELPVDGDADLESSDFDLALDDSDLNVEDEESGSQVMALEDEGDYDELQPATSGEIDVDDDLDAVTSGEFGDIDEDLEPGSRRGGPVREVVKEVPVKAAPWGMVPVIFMLPCVVVMLLVGIMGFELVQTTSGYKSPGVLTRSLASALGMPMK